METSILRLTVAGLALAAGLASPPAAARQSAAPDLAGYTYIDSRESGGPVFDYVDISSSATATRLDLDDNEVAEGIPLGFTFNFYGIDYEEVAISSNGNLAFGAATDYRNEVVLPIPQPAGTDGWQNPPFVAPWFGDLCPSCGDEGAIYYATLGDAPNRRFVVQYRVPPYPGYGNETLDFQVILYEGSNEILFQYQDTTVGDSRGDHGAGATVGIQGTDDAGLNYSAGEAVIEDGLAIRFLPPAGPFIGLNAPADRRAAPGKTVTYRFTLANGTGADAEFTVSLSGHGWQASASPDHMMVAAGDTASFDVTVTTPDIDELTALADRLTVTVSGNGSSASRSVTTRTAPIEQLTYGDRDSEEPRLSADGSKVVFVSNADLLGDGSNADGTRELFVMNTDGTGLKQLTFISDERAWVGQLSLSADGGKVAFGSEADLLGDGSNADGSWELFVINTDGTGLRQLTFSPLKGLWSGQPSLSADGSKVAFVSDADLLGDGSNARNLQEIFVINTDGTGLRQLTFSSLEWLWSEQPSLSADGSKVVFASSADLLEDGSNADGTQEIFVMNTDGTGLRQLTFTWRWNWQPSLSADGSKVAFVSGADLLEDGSNADGSWELFVMNTDGTGLMQVTSLSHLWFDIKQPSLSADGSRVAFVSDADLLGDGSNADGSYELFVINTDGTGLMQVTSLSHLWFDIKQPSLSANGSKVAFAANVDLFGDDPYTKEASQIYVADLALMRALTAGIVVEPSAGLVTSEAGMSATFTVRLTIPPTHEVVLSLSSDDPTEGSVSPVNLHFTPEDWNTPQTVTVTGLDDDEVDGDMPYTVSISAASGDEAYHGKTASVEVVNQDDEQGEQQDDEQGEQPGRGGTKLISGGGGAFGWLSLLGGALLALRRRRVVLALLAGMTLAAPASAEWYAGAMAGRAVGDTDSGDVTAALEAAGIDATAKVKDRTRTAWRLFGGYRWNEYLAVEGGYTDLGKITTRFAGSGSVTLEQLGDDRPASGKGVELAVVGSYPLSESVSGYARFGLWRWKAEYDLRGAVDESDTERGTDPVLGLGIEARLAAAWSVRLGWDRYRVDSEDHDFFGLGLLYRFGEE